jgi:hypothetical protein
VPDAGRLFEELLGIAPLGALGEDDPEIAHGIGLSGPGPSAKGLFPPLGQLTVIGSRDLLTFDRDPARPNGPRRDHTCEEHDGPQ